jgi:hypothetical protein
MEQSQKKKPHPFDPAAPDRLNQVSGRNHTHLIRLLQTGSIKYLEETTPI